MRSILKWLGLMSAGLMVVHPVAALAQTVTRENLVGTWMVAFLIPPHHEAGADGIMVPRLDTVVREIVFTVQADSTWTMQVKENGKPAADETAMADGKGSWSLSGDTLTLGAKMKRKVALRNQQLLFGWLGSKLSKQGDFECNALIFKRIDPAKPLPAWIPPATVKQADLVGTWVLNLTQATGVIADTMILRPDGTSKTRITRCLTGAGRGRLKKPCRTGRKEQPEDTVTTDTAEGKWFLLAGDRLWQASPGSTLGGPKVTLQDRQLSYRGNDREGCADPVVYKRVAP